MTDLETQINEETESEEENDQDKVFNRKPHKIHKPHVWPSREARNMKKVCKIFMELIICSFGYDKLRTVNSF